MNPRFARVIAASVLATAVHGAWAADTPDSAAIRFDIARFDVAGNSLLSPAEIDAAVQPFAGKGRDFGDVQRALEALEAAYHAKGYNVVTVRLPEQELNGGVVRLNVVQTRLGQITVRGNAHASEANVRHAMPTLVVGETPNLQRVSANLRMANENPVRKIRMQLQSAAADDEVDTLLEVTDEKPWKAMLNLDNGGIGETGKTHASAVFQHANLWGRDHVGSLQYTTTVEEPGKVSVWGAGYHIPLYDKGDSVDLFASYSNVDSGAVTAGIFNIAVSGKGAVAGARYNQSLARRGNLDPRLVYGLDYKAYKNSVLFAGVNLGNDVTVHPLSIGYLATLALDNGEVNMSATLVQNIAGGSRGKAEDFARTRSGARASYRLLRFAGAYSRSVAEDWQARLLLNGQWSGDALVPGEQFGAGGASTVRGFDERALSTDSGVSVNAELFTPNLCAASGRWQCRALAFYDTAYGTRNKALPGEFKSSSIASTGFGVRVAMGTSLSLQLDYGHVLREGATASADRNKVHVRLGLAY